MDEKSGQDKRKPHKCLLLLYICVCVLWIMVAQVVIVVIARNRRPHSFFAAQNWRWLCFRPFDKVHRGGIFFLFLFAVRICPTLWHTQRIAECTPPPPARNVFSDARSIVVKTKIECIEVCRSFSYIVLKAKYMCILTLSQYSLVKYLLANASSQQHSWHTSNNNNNNFCEWIFRHNELFHREQNENTYTRRWRREWKWQTEKGDVSKKQRRTARIVLYHWTNSSLGRYHPVQLQITILRNIILWPSIFLFRCCWH